jgi:4-amino-4-deoxy-L-arabinose transferase-like glycosyltransferase
MASSSFSQHSSPRFPIAALTVLLIAFALWVFGLNWLHMREDEHLVYVHTSGTLFETVQQQAWRDVQAPTWHSFFWAWRRLTGDSEFSGRYQGVLWSMLTLSAVYWLMLRWFRAPRFGLFSILILATSTYFFRYGFEIRPYPVVLLSAVLSMGMFARWVRLKTWRTALAYGLTLALMAYIHYFMAFLVVMQGVAFAVTRPIRRQWVQAIGAVGLALLIWLPWLPTMIGQVLKLREIDGGSFGIASTAYPTDWTNIQIWVTLATQGLPVLVAATLLLGVFIVRRWHYGLLLLWGLGVPTLAFTVNLFANVYEPRYIVYSSVGIALALGATLAAIPNRWLRAVTFITLLGLYLAFLQPNLPKRITHRPIYQGMSARYQPETAIYYVQANEKDLYERWLADQYMTPALVAGTVPTVEQALQARYIWYITGVFDEINGAAFQAIEPTHPVAEVLGKCDLEWCYVAQWMVGAPSQTPVTTFYNSQNQDRLDFYGVDVDAIEPSRILTRLWWGVEATPTQDYSFSLRLIAPAGYIAAQFDSPLKTATQVLPTSQFLTDRRLVDHRTLSFAALDAGEYRLELVVYHPIDGYAFRTDQGESYFLQSITIP